jgi:hypothetical protein
MSSLMREMGARALRLGIPLGAQLDLTYRCNERCVHCYLDHDDHGETTLVELKDLFDQFADAGVLFLTISGGEIFLRPDLFDILEHARRLMFSVKIKTNAILIKESQARRIGELGVEGVQIRRSPGLFVVWQPENLLPLSRARLHGGEHARSPHAGLREILRADRPRVRESAIEEGRAQPAFEQRHVHPPRPAAHDSLVFAPDRSDPGGPLTVPF